MRTRPGADRFPIFPVAPASYLAMPGGVRAWLLTHDHKRLGLLYLGTTLGFLSLGTLAAVVAALAGPVASLPLVGPELRHKLLDLHGLGMVFLFVVPAIPGALGNLVLPLMLGLRRVAWPRLALVGFWLYVAGGATLLAAVALGGSGPSWVFYRPFAAEPERRALVYSAAVALLGLSSALNGANLAATIHGRPGPHRALSGVSYLGFALYVTAAAQLLVTVALPVVALVGGLEAWRLGLVEHLELGGAAMAHQLFWFYSHPAIYLANLPALGVVGELLLVHGGRAPLSRRAVMVCVGLLAALGVGGFAYEVLVFLGATGPRASSLSPLLLAAAALPALVLLLGWAPALLPLRRAPSVAGLYALSFVVCVGLGLLSGVWVALRPGGPTAAHGAYQLSHFHVTLFGGTAMAFLGGLHHWWPKFTGRMVHEGWARLAWGLQLLGLLLGFGGVLALGGADGGAAPGAMLPWSFRVLAVWGQLVLAAGLAMTFVTFGRSLRRGAAAPTNPWGGQTLEWQTPSPPPPENFAPGARPEGPGAARRR
ncbi:MAG: cbb3-type cytochrome c oxidase subunit I [Deltaproteobacteria bacterium]|nr:cbb3-type cytochrome c oxidase subunit I [Deltaproteobacteria bacterium]